MQRSSYGSRQSRSANQKAPLLFYTAHKQLYLLLCINLTATYMNFNTGNTTLRWYFSEQYLLMLLSPSFSGNLLSLGFLVLHTWKRQRKNLQYSLTMKSEQWKLESTPWVGDKLRTTVIQERPTTWWVSRASIKTSTR